MKTIHKFSLVTIDEQSILMPAGAVVLTAQLQSGMIVLWAEVDTDKPMVSRHFRVFGTGNPISDYDTAELAYIGTVQMPGDWQLVWHVYEEIK